MKKLSTLETLCLSLAVDLQRGVRLVEREEFLDDIGMLAWATDETRVFS